MHELDDIALLRQYTEQNSEEAFAALVTRHVNKVYSVALRHTRSPHQAEEITQAVFVILARKADKLHQHAALSGWLYQTARLTAVTFIRSEIRRARREQEAHMQTLLNENESDVWPQIAPFLDTAMAGLNETDRHAVVLRFFDGKSMKEVGVVLGASEDAAKMRLNRAVEKLRVFFTKRGIVLPAAVLTAAISANSVQAAPVTLAKTATAVALAKGATVSSSTLILIKGALKVMAWTKAKTAIVVGAGVLLAAGAGAVLVEATRQPDIQGAWEGTLEYGPQKDRLVFKVSKDNGLYRTTVDFVDKGDGDVPFNHIVCDRGAVRFEDGATLTYKASLNADLSEMSGTWTESVGSLPLILKRTNQPDTVPDKLKESDYAPRTGSELQGFWAGTVKAGTNSWLLYFKIAEQPDGTFRAEADSGMVDAKDGKSVRHIEKNTPANSVTYRRSSVKLEFSFLAGSFQGEVNNDHSEMTGTWESGKTTVPLTMKRADPSSEDPRIGAVGGIGVALDTDKQTGAICISQVVPNFPAAQAGLTVGVIIQKIDDVSVSGKTLDECAVLIRGKAGTKVRLQLLDPGKHETNTVELTRQKIQP